MVALIGERVVVLVRTQGDTDDMGEPVWGWERHEVGNVLAKPTSGDQPGMGAERPDGAEATYTLAFPKTEHALLARMRGGLVSLVERGMPDGTDEAARSRMLSVIGEPGFMRPCPTCWDSIVYVGRLDG